MDTNGERLGMTEKILPQKKRFELKSGSYGVYFFDASFDQSLKLEEVLWILNEYERITNNG